MCVYEVFVCGNEVYICLCVFVCVNEVYVRVCK